MTESFGARLRAAMDRFGPLCVGIDPHAALLDQWGLAQDADGLRSFGLAVVDAAAGRAAVVAEDAAITHDRGRIACRLRGVVGQLDRRTAVRRDDLRDQRDRLQCVAAGRVAAAEIVGEVGAPA